MSSLERWAVDAADLTVADAWFARGVLADHQSDHELAARYFCRVVLLDPTDHEAYQRMSKSLTAAGSLAEADQARQRADWLVQTQEIGSAMAKSDRRDGAQIAELIELLDQLRRPLESLSWQAVAVAYGSSTLTADQQRSRLNDINRERLRRINEPQTPPDEAFLCCGVPSLAGSAEVQPEIESVDESQK